jgi:hypothetical protein
MTKRGNAIAGPAVVVLAFGEVGSSRDMRAWWTAVPCLGLCYANRSFTLQLHLGPGKSDYRQVPYQDSTVPVTSDISYRSDNSERIGDLKRCPRVLV